MHKAPSNTRPRGLTLLETVVAIVIGLLVPTLGRTRKFALKAISSANLRSHAATMTAYCGDFSEIHPYFTDPQSQFTVLRAAGLSLAVGYFESHNTWDLALASGYYGGSISSRAFRTPGSPSINQNLDYYYACCFIARPEYWNPTTRTGTTQLRPTRVSDVVFPGKKAILLDINPWLSNAANRNDVWQHGMVDGSVRESDGMGPAYPKGDGSGFAGFYHSNDWPPTMHTLLGVRGRDVE